MQARTPREVPLEEWPRAWLVLELCSILRNPTYMVMTEHEKVEKNLPVTDGEMRAVIRDKRGTK